MVKYQVVVEQYYGGVFETVEENGCLSCNVIGDFVEVVGEGKPRISSELVPEELVRRQQTRRLYFRPIRVEVTEEV